MPALAALDELARLNAQIIKNLTNTELNLRYARIAERYGDYGEAFAIYERVLEYDPSNSEARNDVARADTRLQADTLEIFTGLARATGRARTTSQPANT